MPLTNVAHDEGFTIHDLIEKHAAKQVIDAGGSPAAAKVEANLARNMDFATKQVHSMTQKGLGTVLGLNGNTVYKAIRRLQELGLLIDHDHNLRNKKHRYELTLDWSFSKTLSKTTLATVDPASAPAPAAPKQYPRLRRKGQGQTNGIQGQTCTICSAVVPVGQGGAYKAQTHHLTFCNAHKTFGYAAVEHDWPEGDPFPEDEADRQRLMRGWALGHTGHAARYAAGVDTAELTEKLRHLKPVS